MCILFFRFPVYLPSIDNVRDRVRDEMCVLDGKEGYDEQHYEVDEDSSTGQRH